MLEHWSHHLSAWINAWVLEALKQWLSLLERSFQNLPYFGNLLCWKLKIYFLLKIRFQFFLVSKPIYTLLKLILGFDGSIKKNPNLLNHSQKLSIIHSIKFWVVERTCIPLKVKANSLEHSRCCVVNVDHDIGTRK